MRDFGKVAPQFWTGKTGKGLRGCMEAQVVALYLMTSPHATMIGVYSLPMLYLIHETGLTEEGASKGLARCIEAGFCVYDAEAETVFVVNMAAHQVGDVLKPGDKRGNPIRSQFRAIHSTAIKAAFFARYGSAFSLESPQSASPFEGACEGAFMPPSPSPSPSLEGGVGETDLAIPLADGSDYAITLAAVAEWEQAYPRLDVMGELRKARAWCVANPRQRKTRAGAGKFLNGWLSRATERATPVPAAPSKASLPGGGRREL